MVNRANGAVKVIVEDVKRALLERPRALRPNEKRVIMACVLHAVEIQLVAQWGCLHCSDTETILDLNSTWLKVHLTHYS